VVLSCELEADLEQEKDDRIKRGQNESTWTFPEKEGSYDLKIVLHTVFFGSKPDLEQMSKLVEQLRGDVRDQWRIKITTDDSNKLKEP
jgi:hypothetical protein